ncbi:polysaccharide deacetylase family protein [Vibrio sp. S4M6]|uniref:polysaccharide deacetylase family protein n=1 Tax=Vibrio sinus TaxID=2946865 RepID=UPI00202ABA11|nr:polysaccharide deacetylase family protein [Vibrio sinus]MCL9781555.1 polysaccharide deacetylase family protein [Vibrio sinus]
MTKDHELTMLLYHGVTNTSPEGIANYSGKHIAANAFDDQMRILHNHCNVLTIDDVVTLTREKKDWPENAVVVTFDDGFRNNLQCAAPILEKYNIPATFYICAGMVGTDQMFWVDEIEDCINRTLHSTITITLDKKRYFELTSPEAKISAIESIKQFCKRSTSVTKNRVLADLTLASDITPNVKHSANYQMMSWDELIELNSNPLFTIGGHTLYHDIMSSRPVEEMTQDVKETLSLLEQKLGHPIRHFAYPEGQAHHYSEEVITSLKNYGVSICPTAIDGTNPPGSDLFHLKRIMPGFMNRAFPILSEV